MKALSGIALAASVVIAAPAMAQAVSPADYVAKAGASDLYERTSSQLVLESSKKEKVRQFAQMMVTDHTKSTAEVKAAAQQSGLTPPPPKLDAEQTRMVSQLRQATGEARDRLYITQQKTAHQKALALHQGYATSGTAVPLKAVAAKTAPVVQHHIEMLNGM